MNKLQSARSCDVNLNFSCAPDIFKLPRVSYHKDFHTSGTKYDNVVKYYRCCPVIYQTPLACDIFPWCFNVRASSSYKCLFLRNTQFFNKLLKQGCHGTLEMIFKGEFYSIYFPAIWILPLLNQCYSFWAIRYRDTPIIRHWLMASIQLRTGSWSPSPLILSRDSFSLWTWDRVQTAHSIAYFNGRH